jgi:hypothetical protein
LSNNHLQVISVRGDFNSNDTIHCFWLIPMLGLNDSRHQKLLLILPHISWSSSTGLSSKKQQQTWLLDMT